MEARLHDELQVLKSRNEILDDENRNLRLNKHEQDSRVWLSDEKTDLLKVRPCSLDDFCVNDY